MIFDPLSLQRHKNTKTLALLYVLSSEFKFRRERPFFTAFSKFEYSLCKNHSNVVSLSHKSIWCRLFDKHFYKYSIYTTNHSLYVDLTNENITKFSFICILCIIMQIFIHSRNKLRNNKPVRCNVQTI